MCAVLTMLSGCGEEKKASDESKNVDVKVASTQEVEDALKSKDEKNIVLDSRINDAVICTSPEPMAASRFATICYYLGVKDVRVMNGGLVQWKSLGYELEKGLYTSR